MTKRIVLLLCTVLLLCAAIGPVGAKTQSEEDRICEQIASIHSRSLEATEKESLSGFCGLQVSWELYLLGINTSLLTYDGNKHYDVYSTMDRTSGGYWVEDYPAQEYTLREALEEICGNGTKDVYNIMVGFEKTNTEAGQKFGHVCMIHAILDGKVYFVEGFTTSFGVPEGQANIVSIPEFVAYWENWTQYEGLVYFGQKDPLLSCDHVRTDLYIQTEQDLPLVDRALSQERRVVRTVPAGERLRATAIYDSGEGFYYEIDEDGTLAYLAAEHTIPLIYGMGTAALEEPQFPEKLEEGASFAVQGKVLSPDEIPVGVQMTVRDAQGAPVLTYGETKPGQKYDLNRWTVQKSMDLRQLPEGSYTYEVHVLLERARLSQGKLLKEVYSCCLANAPFTVGDVPVSRMAEGLAENGWVLRNDKWSCYDKGVLRTGWYCENGLRYYFGADGTAVIGWTEVEGQLRYFSRTGAMRTGWVCTDKGRLYLKEDGTRVVGWYQVEDVRCFFDQAGLQKQQGWVLEGERLYYLLEDGSMAVGWVDLPQGRFSFHTDGHLVARLVDGKTVPYAGEWLPEELRKGN